MAGQQAHIVALRKGAEPRRNVPQDRQPAVIIMAPERNHRAFGKAALLEHRPHGRLPADAMIVIGLELGYEAVAVAMRIEPADYRTGQPFRHEAVHQKGQRIEGGMKARATPPGASKWWRLRQAAATSCTCSNTMREKTRSKDWAAGSAPRSPATSKQPVAKPSGTSASSPAEMSLTV